MKNIEKIVGIGIGQTYLCPFMIWKMWRNTDQLGDNSGIVVGIVKDHAGSNIGDGRITVYEKVIQGLTAGAMKG
ncbi:MAG: hypothetical protein Q4C61_16930 [Lachnospiraceae bacterium]|nr:hypothetical protein [Lachnospiraceae bacterium]